MLLYRVYRLETAVFQFPSLRCYLLRADIYAFSLTILRHSIRLFLPSIVVDFVFHMHVLANTVISVCMGVFFFFLGGGSVVIRFNLRGARLILETNTRNRWANSMTICHGQNSVKQHGRHTQHVAVPSLSPLAYFFLSQPPTPSPQIKKRNALSFVSVSLLFLLLLLSFSGTQQIQTSFLRTFAPSLPLSINSSKCYQISFFAGQHKGQDSETQGAAL